MLPAGKARPGRGNSSGLASLNSACGLWVLGWYLALSDSGHRKYWLGIRKLDNEGVWGMDLGLAGAFVM